MSPPGISIDFKDDYIYTNNIFELSQFYKNILACQVVEDAFHMKIVLNYVNLHIIDYNHAIESGLLYTSFANFELCFYVNNINSEYKRIRDLGVDNLTFDDTNPSRFSFFDPDGNRIIFIKMNKK